MKAKCIRGEFKTLIEGKIYKIEPYIETQYYSVMEQDGQELGNWFKNRFEIVTSDIEKRNDLIKELKQLQA